jgi:hypothetical protein
MFVFELPADITTAILSRWIDLQALAWLDSALCAAKSRKQFKQLVGGESFVADTLCTCSLMSRKHYVQHLAWLVNRLIKVRNWVVNWEIEQGCSDHLLRCSAGPHVRTLQLRKLTQLGMSRVFDMFIAACSGLRELRIEHCSHFETICALRIPVQQSLQVLVVESCTGGHWESPVKFPNLRKLCVRFLDGIVMQPVTTLLNAAPNLTDLRLSSAVRCPFSDANLQILSNHAANLKILELDIQRQEFTSTAVVSLAESSSNLKMLALACGNGVNDAAVEAFAIHCTQLEGLQMWGKMSAASFSTVVAHRGSSLRYLAVAMTGFDPVGLVSIAEHCRLLEELQLCNCRSIEDEGDPLVRLVSSLPHLRELQLVNSRAVSDEVLIAIATHLPNLQHLGLSGCDGYTTAGALALMTSLTHLQRFCYATDRFGVFTPPLLALWQEMAPGLKIYDHALSTHYFERMYC